MNTLLAIRDKRAYGWAVLVAFTINYAFVVVVFMTLGLLLPDIREELGIDVRGAGWLASSLLIANLFLEIPLNWLLSKFRPWRVSTIAFFGTLAMVFLHAFSPTFAILIIARVGLGVFYLSSQPPRTLLILMWIPKKSVGIANGVLFGIMAFFEGLGFVLIPRINEWTGDWRQTLLIWAILCAVGTLVWTIIGVDRKSMQLEPDPDPPSQSASPLRALVNYKEPWVLGLGLALVIAGRLAFDTWWPTFVTETYGIEKTTAGLILAVISISGFPSSLGLSAIPVLVRNPGLTMIAGGALLASSYIVMLFTGSLLYLFLLGLVNGLAFGFFPIMMASFYNLRGIQPRDLAIVVALVYTIMWSGAAIGPVLAGFLAGEDENLKFGLLILCMGPIGLSFAGIWLMFHHRPSPEEPLDPPQPVDAKLGIAKSK